MHTTSSPDKDQTRALKSLGLDFLLAKPVYSKANTTYIATAVREGYK